jgi:hypothetical protein
MYLTYNIIGLHDKDQSLHNTTINVGTSSCKVSQFCAILSKVRKCQQILVRIAKYEVHENHLV